MTAATAAQLAALPAEAQACRDLRHAWPRRPEHKHLVTLEATKLIGGRVHEATRRMWCTGDCGAERVEKLRRGRGGTMVRVQKPAIKYHKPYLLERDDPDVPIDRPDPDAVRFAVMQRMFPDLKW